MLIVANVVLGLSMVVSGWPYASATGVQVVYPGLVPLSELVPSDEALAGMLKGTHAALNFTLFALVFMHTAAALKHYFVDRDHAHAPANPPERKRRMMVLLRSFVPSLGVLLLAANQAGAQSFLIDKSEIRFVSKQLGVNLEGWFRKWKANIVFLPKDLAKSKAEFEIDLGSIDLASEESETVIKSALWFNTAKFPVARFASTSIEDLSGDRYEVAGKLTLKGITKNVVVPIALKKDATGNSVAEGSFPLKRIDYRVGEGMWTDTEMVDNDVVVRVRMVLPPLA